jgi:hypothetical protein
MFPTNKPPQDFASWIMENKPHLIEIEEQIQKVGLFGEMDIKITIHEGQVQKLQFYGGRTWKRSGKN